VLGRQDHYATVSRPPAQLEISAGGCIIPYSGGRFPQTSSVGVGHCEQPADAQSRHCQQWQQGILCCVANTSCAAEILCSLYVRQHCNSDICESSGAPLDIRPCPPLQQPTLMLPVLTPAHPLVSPVTSTAMEMSRKGLNFLADSLVWCSLLHISTTPAHNTLSLLLLAPGTGYSSDPCHTKQLATYRHCRSPEQLSWLPASPFFFSPKSEYC
jgi:hypothetical protein